MSNPESEANKTMNVLLDGKLIGIFCHTEGDKNLEDRIIRIAEPKIGNPDIFQFAINTDKGFADFLTWED